MFVSLHLLLFCRLQVAHFVEELMNQAVVFPLKNIYMKLIIWVDQGGPLNRPPQQGPNLYERTTKLKETLAQFMQVSMSNHKSTESAIKYL